MISTSFSMDEFREITAGCDTLRLLRFAEQESADADALGATPYADRLRALISELSSNPTYEIRTVIRDDGTPLRTLTVLASAEPAQRAVHDVLAEGLTDDMCHALALAAARVLGLKLVSPDEQEAAIAELRTRHAPSPRRAQQIGEADLVQAVKQAVNEGPSIPDAAYLDAIRRAAYRLRFAFVKADIGWQEHKRGDIALTEDVDSCETRDQIEIDIAFDEATAQYLRNLTPEQLALLGRKVQGYSKKECGQLLGWTDEKVARVWRSIASDRIPVGRTLHDELVFLMAARYKGR